MKKVFLFLISFLSIFQCASLHAQKWAVHFTDKNNSIYSIDRPDEFLSQRAIERRIKFNIGITEEDFPVNKSYIEQLKQLGVDIIGTSKWFNCALINPNSQDIMTAIEQLEFVEKIVQVDNYSTNNSDLLLDGNYYNWDSPIYKSTKLESTPTDSEYGLGYHQINQVNGISLHKRGFTGQGVLITVLDAGFENTNQLDVFAHIRARNGIVFEYSVVRPGESIYTYPNYPFDHGTNVFSCMGSKIEGVFIGTAPDADYALIRTDETASAFLIEEYNWAIGAELADSLGSDIINSSLAYAYSPYSDQDGRKPVSSYAAFRAVEKGMFVCASAGNNGFIPSRRWIYSPADTPEVATIGAVYRDGQVTNFSAIGPNAIGSPKPDIVALGADVTIALSTNEIVTSGGGTSMSSPIVCGMVACLIQAFPQIPPLELKEMINRTGNYYGNHQVDYGYGIPDFDKVYANHTGISKVELSLKVRAYPNPVIEILHITSEEELTKIVILDFYGRIYDSIDCNSTSVTLNMSSYNKGLWLVNIKSKSGIKKTLKIVKI